VEEEERGRVEGGGGGMASSDADLRFSCDTTVHGSAHSPSSLGPPLPRLLEHRNWPGCREGRGETEGEGMGDGEGLLFMTPADMLMLAPGVHVVLVRPVSVSE
jgi:hypothetical protein